MFASRSRRRDGFTLLELLIVIAILSLIAALSAAATLRVMGQQVHKNTERSLQKMQSALAEQWKAAADEAFNEPMSANVRGRIMGLARQDHRLARVIYVKLRLRQEFPMTFAEARNPSPLPPIQQYVQDVNLVNWNDVTNRSESAVCLYLALKRSRKGMSFDPDNSLSPKELENVGTGVKQIVDFWGMPVAFFRWPAEHPYINPENGYQSPPWQDTTDPDGLMAGSTQFDQYHPIPNKNRSFRLFPVIVSGGPSGPFANNGDPKDPWLGLNPRGMKPNSDYYQDNVYSFNTRLGAQGN